ncbi:Microspherule protein 1, partial [Mucuna pruriens]
MDPVEVLPPWVPEDDLLLKNSIEAGASLESLAKGAVRFSRRYSLTELRDRWRSLLYDVNVSAAAAVAMANLELAKYGGGAGIGSGDGGRKKRKVMSIRRHYYAMQRRLRRHRQGVASSDVKNAVECEGKESAVIDDNLNLNNDVVNNSLGGYGDCLGLEGVGELCNSASDVPLWKTIEDVSLPDLSNVGGKSSGSGGVLKSNAPDAVLGDDAMRISECLLNLPNEHELLFIDVEGKEVTAADKDKPYYDNVDSLLLNSPCDDGDGHELQKLEAETKLAVPSGCASDGLGVVADPLGSSCGDQHFVSASENDAGSSAGVGSPRPEHGEGFMICVLNSEDPDIPCNDITHVAIVVPDLAALKSQPIVKEVGYLESAINNQRRNEPEGGLKKEAVLSQSFAASQTVRQGLVSNVNSRYPPVVLGLKAENPGRNSISAVSRQNNNVIVNTNPSHGRLVRATVIPASDGHLKQEGIDAPASAEFYAHVKAEEHKALSKSEAKSVSLDQEGDDIEDGDENDNNDDDDDSDDEIPNFSDAETMILEMDLCPTDQDTNESRQVLRYKHEESKRTIMRLEQGAQSSMGRAITSQGAFAVVYGRILKKYIRKSKVILGRATRDVQVDIDLGKEGEAAKKISRRQALIKLEANGSFIIKNLGKKSIFLNGKEIATGQARGLSASSVIEIRGISLLFEVNNRCVKRFLENENEKR